MYIESPKPTGHRHPGSQTQLVDVASQLTAVNHQRAARDAARRFRSQVQGGAGDLVRFDKTFKRDQLALYGLGPRRVGARFYVAPDHRRFHGAGTDAVDADIIAGIIQRQGLAQLQHPTSGGDIGRRHVLAGEAAGGSRIDDTTDFLLFHT